MSSEKHVFIAYREPVENVARKLAKYLIDNDMKVWFFPWKVGWGDSITAEEDEGLKNSFSGIIVFTPDFLKGKTAREEYRALLALKRSNESYKIGILRVNCPRNEVPPFLLDYFDCHVESETDGNFNIEAEKILRGIRGLPIEDPTPFSQDKVQTAQTAQSFQEYMKIYTFARDNMLKSSLSAHKFAEEWIKQYQGIPFSHFIEIFNFAKQKMSKSSISAQKFAFYQINKLK